MFRFIFLALLAVGSVTYADYRVDQQFAEQGYSAQDRAALDRLLEKALAKPAAKAHKAMTEAEKARAVIYLWGDAK